MLVQTVITVLCGVGLYVSVFMQRKLQRALRGELSERSVVQTARARLFGTIPNAAIGLVYYPLFAAGIWGATRPWELEVLLVASGAAAAVSVVLAYSLHFVTRMPCPYCWTAHAINWTLVICNVLLLFKISYWR